MNLLVHNASRYPFARATSGASGFDLHATSGGAIMPGGRRTIETGIYLAIPPGYEGQIRPRSGLARKHGVVAVIGTIDSDYRGEVGVTLMNHGEDIFVFAPGDRIAQIVFAMVLAPACAFVVAKSELPATERGEGGFGSSGMGPLAIE